MNSLTNWNPFREMETMQDRILRAMNLSASRNGEGSGTVTEWSPSVDISEDDKEYVIKAELPEVDKENVKVVVENGVLYLKGERKFEKEEKNKKYHRIERSYGSFMRSFTLPDDADPAKVAAMQNDLERNPPARFDITRRLQPAFPKWRVV
mgnify:CR=1 FL=1